MMVITEEAAKLGDKGEDTIFCAESMVSTKVPYRVLAYTLENFRNIAIGPEALMTGLPDLKRLSSEDSHGFIM
jgi:hypothetical protein